MADCSRSRSGGCSSRPDGRCAGRPCRRNNHLYVDVSRRRAESGSRAPCLEAPQRPACGTRPADRKAPSRRFPALAPRPRHGEAVGSRHRPAQGGGPPPAARGQTRAAPSPHKPCRPIFLFWFLAAPRPGSFAAWVLAGPRTPCFEAQLQVVLLSRTHRGRPRSGGRACDFSTPLPRIRSRGRGATDPARAVPADPHPARRGVRFRKIGRPGRLRIRCAVRGGEASNERLGPRSSECRRGCGPPADPCPSRRVPRTARECPASPR